MSSSMRYEHPNLLLRRYHLKRLSTVVTTIRQVTKQVTKTGNRRMSFLDVGCSNGVYEHILKNDFDHMVGVDISLHDLKIAKCRLKDKRGKEFILADAHHLPFKDSSFDVVLCSEVLEHLHDPSKALTELARTFRKVLLITVPTLSISRVVARAFLYDSKLREIDKQVGHIHMHNPLWWIRLISRVVGEMGKSCTVKVTYLHISAEPLSAILSRCRNAVVFNVIDRCLDFIERKILSRFMFANHIVIVIVNRHFHERGRV